MLRGRRKEQGSRQHPEASPLGIYEFASLSEMCGKWHAFLPFTFSDLFCFQIIIIIFFKFNSVSYESNSEEFSLFLSGLYNLADSLPHIQNVPSSG